MQIFEFAREHDRVTISDAVKLTGTSRNTLKAHFRKLFDRECWIGTVVVGGGGMDCAEPSLCAMILTTD